MAAGSTSTWSRPTIVLSVTTRFMRSYPFDVARSPPARASMLHACGSWRARCDLQCDPRQALAQSDGKPLLRFGQRRKYRITRQVTCAIGRAAACGLVKIALRVRQADDQHAVMEQRKHHR